MLTDTRQALLNAIRDQPDDDAPRLIYADWLDENGDPDRASFIRLQCRYARLKRWLPEAVILRQQWQALEETHGQRWRADIPTWTNEGTFWRGFLDGATLTTTAELQHDLATAWQREPLSNLTINGFSADMAALFNDPLMQHIRGLTYFTTRTSDLTELQALTASPYVQNLQHLFLTFEPTQAFPATLLERFRSWRLPHLRKLSLAFFQQHQRRFIDAIQEALLGGELISRLTNVDLFNVPSDRVATAFGQRVTSTLQEFSVAGNDDLTPWLRSLLAVRRDLRLRVLNLCSSFRSEGIASPVWRPFLASPLFRTIRELAIQGNDWTDTTIVDLAAAPHAAQLEHLDLQHARHVTDASAAALAQSPYLRSLQSLSIIDTGVTPAGIQQLRHAFPTCYVFDKEV